MALADTAKLVASLELQDKFSRPAATITGSLTRMESGFSQMARGAGQVAGGLDRLGTRAALLAGAGLGAVVKTAIDFEDAFAGVRKTVDATDAQLDALQDSFREMARTVPLSFEELSKIGEQAGALGIARENIEEFTRVAALIGVTTDVSSDQAATSLGVLSNVLRLTQKDYDNFGATLVDLGNKGASTESAILAIAERAGAGAKLVGLNAEETLGWASAIANLGIEAEAGGSSLQTFYLKSLQAIKGGSQLENFAKLAGLSVEDFTKKIQSSSEEQERMAKVLGISTSIIKELATSAEGLDKFAATAGVTSEAFEKAFGRDPSRALALFIKGLGDLSQAEQLATLKALGFRDIRITRALLGLAGNTDNLTSSLNTSAAAWEKNSALQTEAEKRFATTASQVTLLKNNLRDTAFTIGAELLPIGNELIKDFLGELNKPGTQAGIRTFAQDLAGGIRGLAAELKGTDFSGLIDGVKLAATVAKGAFDAFRSLPQPVQQLAIAALVANKVSGGAVGQIAGGLANIFGGALKTIRAAHVTVIGGAGGAPVGAAPVAARGGALGRVGGFLGTVGILAADALLIGEAVAQFQRTAADVDVARDFVQKVVDDRSRNATVGELQKLNADLKGEIAREMGDPLSGLLKWAFVNPTLEQQQKETEFEVAQQSALIYKNHIIAQANYKAGVFDTINEFRAGRMALAAQMERVADRVAEARAAIGTGFQRNNTQLGIIAEKDFSPTVNVDTHVNTSVSISDITRQLAITHVATDFHGGFTETF